MGKLRPERPTLAQKKAISRAGLLPDNWMVLDDGSVSMVILKMEKPTKALLPEIFNTKTDEDFAKVIEEAATVYANLIVELVQSFPEKDLPVILFALRSVEETFAELSPTSKVLSDKIGKGLNRQVIVCTTEGEDV